MANAGFGLPQPYTLGTLGGTAVRPLSNLTNDEPGLVFESSSVANNAQISIDFDFVGPLSFVALLGLKTVATIDLRGYSSAANRAASSPAEIITTTTGPLSTNKSSTHSKIFLRFTDKNHTYYRLTLTNTSGGAATFEFWRLLLGKWIEPADNIEVQAQASIDDRSARRYSSTGRRNFTTYGVFSTFTGKWPWISDTEYKSQIKPMMLQYGASKPVLFCLDYAESVWGQDGLYYGDLERDQAIVLDDGQLYSYAFTIVDIAPVDLTA